MKTKNMENDNETVVDLVEALNKLYSKKDVLIEPQSDCCSEMFFNNNDEDVSNAEAMCNKLLITDVGECDWNNINYLRENGYKVYAGESDSFGWLTGCVRKIGTNVVLVYG